MHSSPCPYFPPQGNLVFQFCNDMLFKKCGGGASGGWFYLVEEILKI